MITEHGGPALLSAEVSSISRSELESNYLQAQLPGRTLKLVNVSELADPGLASQWTPLLEAAQSGAAVVVLKYGPTNLREYFRYAKLLCAASAPEHCNVVGLSYSEKAQLQLHDARTGCFAGYADVRQTSSDIPLHESVGNSSAGDLGYEYCQTNLDLRLIEDPQRLLGARSWKDFLPVLPLRGIHVCGGETFTPVLELPTFATAIGASQCLVKDESRNLTCSFKDRQNFVAINKAIEDGETTILINSSGNAAVSAAAYAKMGNLACVAVIPEDTSESKRALLREFGATIQALPGNYEKNHRWLIASGMEGVNVTPGVSAVGLDGIKLIAYELISQGVAPDVVVAPAGNGSLIAGLYKGFRELKEMGLIPKLPRLIAVQVRDAAPLKLALERGTLVECAKKVPESRAEAIIAEESFSSPVAVMALRSSQGEVVEVDDLEMAHWQSKLRKEFGIVSEFSSAAAFAAVAKMRFKHKESVVVINTAGGYKDLLADMQEKQTCAPAIALRFRPISSLAECVGVEDLQRRAFGFDEREIVPAEFLTVLADTGGLIVGAYDPQHKLVGFCTAVLAKDERGIYLHSDLAAVDPALQSSGIGHQLKLEQARIARERGFNRICWTFDPMLTKNANLNIRKLGGVGVTFKRNVYGASSSALSTGLPTHRLLIEWNLEAAPHKVDSRDAFDATSDGVHLNGPPEARPAKVIVGVPLDFLELKKRNMLVAGSTQEHFARTAEQLFAGSYRIEGFERDEKAGMGYYIFCRGVCEN